MPAGKFNRLEAGLFLFHEGSRLRITKVNEEGFSIDALDLDTKETTTILFEKLYIPIKEKESAIPLIFAKSETELNREIEKYKPPSIPSYDGDLDETHYARADKIIAIVKYVEPRLRERRINDLEKTGAFVQGPVLEEILEAIPAAPELKEEHRTQVAVRTYYDNVTFKAPNRLYDHEAGFGE